MSRRIDGKSIIVTGGGDGIGAAIARGLAAEGGRIVVADIDQAQAERIAASIREKSGSAVASMVDVVDRASVRAIIGEAVSAFGRLDVMFNNAGVSTAGPFLEATEMDWTRITGINGLGVLIGVQEAAKQFITQKSGGKIINTASIVGRHPDPIAAVYSASKATVISITQSAAQELGQHKITVNCFSPGFVKTNLWNKLDRQLMDAGISTQPGIVDELATKKTALGRVSTPEDLVGVATFLASSESDYMTGQNLTVDGGIVMI